MKMHLTFSALIEMEIQPKPIVLLAIFILAVHVILSGYCLDEVGI